MSESELKQIRVEGIIKDAVKGSILAVALYVVWGAFMDQIKETKQELDHNRQEIRELRSEIKDCQTEKKNRIEQGIDFIINKLNHENNRKN
jgi:septal ring factor EnvC (AmiA/AmiB activator)